MPRPTRSSSRELARAQRRYRYRPAAQNLLFPLAANTRWPLLAELYSLRWILGMLPHFVPAQARKLSRTLRFWWERITFRFDRQSAYRRLFGARDRAPFEDEEKSASDAAFAFYRLAGPNPLVIQQERDLVALRQRIPFDTARCEAWLAARAHHVKLASEAVAGRLFAVDYQLIQTALGAPRDSRFRDKYLAAPIAVFLEAPGVNPGCELVPLAIRIDRPQPNAEPNPVHYPDDGWGWRIAKAYFEASDTNFHTMVGHTSRTHIALEAFCIATARQLPKRHPVHLLLRPHLRFTLPSARAAYRHYMKRRTWWHGPKAYFRLYSGTLEDTRSLVKADFAQRSFPELGLIADLTRRGVRAAPVSFPYRDDALLWVDAIQQFVSAYVNEFFASDAQVAGDAQLAAWAAELMDPRQGGVRGMLPGGALDTRQKLIDLLAQLLFTAGPYHSSQHYAEAYYLRNSAIFPSGAWRPPPWDRSGLDRAHWLRMLPPIDCALTQFTYNSFVAYRYDRFGSYRGHALGREPRARAAIAQLQAALEKIETDIAQRSADRLFRYDFLRPSLVTNSTNI